MTEKTFWIKQTGSNLVNENLIVSTRYHIDTETGRYHSVTLFDGGSKANDRGYVTYASLQEYVRCGYDESKLEYITDGRLS